MAYLIVHLLGSMQYIVTEQVVRYVSMRFQTHASSQNILHFHNKNAVTVTIILVKIEVVINASILTQHISYHKTQMLAEASQRLFDAKWFYNSSKEVLTGFMGSSQSGQQNKNI